MEYTALEIATLLGGSIEGNPDIKVNNLSKIEEGKPSTLSFLGNPKYEEYIYSTNASIVIVSKQFIPSKTVQATLIKVEDPYKAFSKLLEVYNSKKQDINTGIQQPSFIHENAEYGDNLSVGAFSYIGKGCKIGHNVKIYTQVYIGENVTIGDHCILYPGVKIYQNCVIGSGVIVHANAVIGSDGFGYSKDSEGRYIKIPQTGNVVIEDDVEIGASTTIDSATLGSTVIGKGVKLDNLVQVAHNVVIGEHTAIAAMVGVSGSVKIGKRCTIAGQVGFSGHIEIADDVMIGPQAGVTKSFKTPGTILLGAPAYEVRESKRIFAVTRRLPDMADKLSKLEKEMEAIKKSLSSHNSDE